MDHSQRLASDDKHEITFSCTVCVLHNRCDPAVYTCHKQHAGDRAVSVILINEHQHQSRSNRTMHRKQLCAQHSVKPDKVTIDTAYLYSDAQTRNLDKVYVRDSTIIPASKDSVDTSDARPRTSLRDVAAHCATSFVASQASCGMTTRPLNTHRRSPTGAPNSFMVMRLNRFVSILRIESLESFVPHGAVSTHSLVTELQGIGRDTSGESSTCVQVVMHYIRYILCSVTRYVQNGMTRDFSLHLGIFICLVDVGSIRACMHTCV